MLLPGVLGILLLRYIIVIVRIMLLGTTRIVQDLSSIIIGIIIVYTEVEFGESPRGLRLGGGGGMTISLVDEIFEMLVKLGFKKKKEKIEINFLFGFIFKK